MGDLRDRIQEGRQALEKLMEAIPGFRGYMDREHRREADKLLREHLVSLLNQVRGKLSRLQSQLSAEKLYKPVSDLNRINRRLLRTCDRIQHASYGYAGFFDPQQIGTEELDRLYVFDQALEQHVAAVDAAAAALLQAAEAERLAAIGVLSAALDTLDHMVDERNEAAAAATP